MAARENQGLQAIVITLTILVLLLGVGLLLVNNARKTAVATAKDASERATRASGDQAKAQSEAENYKQWIGFQSSDAFDTFAGNQCRRKFETIASPASRSERGPRLQSGRGCTPGASGSSDRLSASFM